MVGWKFILSSAIKTKFIRGYLDHTERKVIDQDGIIYIEDESSKLTKTCPGVFLSYIQDIYV